MIAYYNEVDPYATAWLENLIRAGHISFGIVDTRSIEDVYPEDLREFDRCHFFAGIGVWDYALNLAGWPEDRRVWTGSCPCQPFSTAGKGRGFADERHLWPAWHHLIRECRPADILGEQIDGVDGRMWVDLVQTDLEADDYAFGPIVLPAAGVGAPHGRHRTWFVAHATGARQSRREDAGADRGDPGALQSRGQRCARLCEPQRDSAIGYVAEPDGAGRKSRIAATTPARYGHSVVTDGGVGVAASRGRQGIRAEPEHGEPVQTGAVSGFWSDADWLYHRDGRYRPVEPGTFPLAYGAPSRVGRLRAYGNALCAEAAKAFIDAVLQCEP